MQSGPGMGDVWLRIPLPLAWLMELDHVESPYALKDAFGDAYLCKHNPVYGRLRQAAIDRGYTFSCKDTPLWRDYQALSLATLQQIVPGKTIPYLDTGNTIRRLLAQNPDTRVPPGVLLSNLRRNHTFHEAAHCVAHSVLDGRVGFVLSAILTESFANTVEMLGTLPREKPVSDALFYTLNSYFRPKSEFTHILGAAESAGLKQRFTLLLLFFFEANLAVEGEPGNQVIDRVGMAARVNDTSAHLLADIGKAAYRLNGGFRENTTPWWFELLNCKAEYLSLKNSGWVAERENRTFIDDVTHALWDAAGNP